MIAKIKVISCNDNFRLENQVNEFVYQFSSDNIIDIKYKLVFTTDRYIYSALIIYKIYN